MGLGLRVGVRGQAPLRVTMRTPVFHGSSADAPLSAASCSRAATISGRVPCSRVSRIWKRAALPKPSACVTL